MGFIQCCGALQRSKSFLLQPQDGFLHVRYDWLESCKYCSHTVLQLTRIDVENRLDVVRKINSKARKMKEKLQPQIITEIDKNFSPQCFNNGSFYLFYNEFGTKKRCYSNFSTLKMGLGEDLIWNQKNFLLIPKNA